MKRMFALLTALMLLLSACSSATVDGAGKEVQDTITNITDADNKYVQMVKGGYRTDDPDLTYEDAFSAFFGTPRWKYFESEDGQDVVEFTGDCTYKDVPVKARIQFIVDEENGTFEATYLAFNEVPQDALTLAAVISKAFEEIAASSENIDSDDFYYKGKSLSGLLGASSDRVTDAFGQPTGGTPVTGELLYGGTEYWIYDDVCIYLNGETVAQIGANPEMVTYHGMTLNMNRSELYAEFGEPLNEDNIEAFDGDGRSCYFMQYIFDGIVANFEMPDANSDSDFITISMYDTDDPIDNDAYLGDDGDGGYYANLDSALVGRWRSYDGGMLEFDDTGVISSCDFKCWSLGSGTPDYIYWEASNGRVACSAYFNEGFTYEISTSFDGSEIATITFANTEDWAALQYRRESGASGDGIVGTWISTLNTNWSYQFNDDGTGVENGRYPITWYADTANDGSDAVSYTLLDSGTYFDYTVTGDTLTVFLSDSSRIYTKVGN